MKATISLKSLEKVGRDLEKVYLDFSDVCEKAVYDGAGPVADTMRGKISAIKTSKNTHPDRYDPHTWGRGGYERPDAEGNSPSGRGCVWGLTESQKQGLLAGMGISPYRKELDCINKKVGVEGYNDTVTKKYPKGQPNAMILRSIESGTSWHQKNPVVRPTANSTRVKVRRIMEKTINEEINKRMK